MVAKESLKRLDAEKRADALQAELEKATKRGDDYLAEAEATASARNYDIKEKIELQQQLASAGKCEPLSADEIRGVLHAWFAVKESTWSLITRAAEAQRKKMGVAL
jgi:hypothetical protein